jgi:hypothetical protein
VDADFKRSSVSSENITLLTVSMRLDRLAGSAPRDPIASRIFCRDEFPESFDKASTWCTITVVMKIPAAWVEILYTIDASHRRLYLVVRLTKASDGTLTKEAMEIEAHSEWVSAVQPAINMLTRLGV